MKTQGSLAGLCFTLSKTFLNQSLIFSSSFVFLFLVFLIEDVNKLFTLVTKHAFSAQFVQEGSVLLFELNFPEIN